MFRTLLLSALFLLPLTAFPAMDAAPIAPVVKNGDKITFRTPVMMLDKKHLINGGGRQNNQVDKKLYAAVQLGHDGQNLLFRIHVNDSHVENSQPASAIWMQDGVEIFIAAPEGKTFACGKNVHFMISAPDKNNRVKFNTLSSGKLSILPEYSGRNVKDGYEIDLKVPFELLAPYDIRQDKNISVKVFVDDWDPSDGDPQIHFQPRVLAIPVGNLREGNYTGFFLAGAEDVEKPYAVNAWWMPEYSPVTDNGRIVLPLDCPLEYDSIRAKLTDKQGNIIREKEFASGTGLLELTGIGSTMELFLKLELYAKGRCTGYISLPYINLQKVMELLSRLDLHREALHSPVRAAAYLNVIATVESLKFAAVRERPETPEIIRELECKLALLAGSPLPDNIPDKQQMLNLTAGFQAQCAVEFDHRERPFGAERVFVSIPWGNIPLVQAEVLFFPTAAIAENYLKWRMAFTVRQPSPAVSGADEVAAGRGHLWFSCRNHDRDFTRTVALSSPRYPDRMLHLEFTEAEKLAPSEVIRCADSPLATVPVTPVPGRQEKLTAYSGTRPNHRDVTSYISTYGVETGILMARRGNIVYETAYNNPELDRRFMQLLLDNRPLTGADAAKFRDLRAAELEKKYGCHERNIPFLSGDMHTHTIYSDGSATPAGMLAESLYAGLDFLLFSDHNRMDVKYFMDEIARKSNCRFNYACGIEATFHNLFHLNIYPLDKNIDLNGHYWDIFRQAAAQGAMIQLNHPFSTANAFRELWYNRIDDSQINAVERNISRLDIWRKQGINMLVTGGSDTHTGCFSHQEVTILGCETFSGAALLRAFRERKVAMVAPRLGEYLAGDPDFTAGIGSILLKPDNPEKFGRRLAGMLENFNAAEYIRHSSPVSPLPVYTSVVDKKYNTPYRIKKISEP